MHQLQNGLGLRQVLEQMQTHIHKFGSWRQRGLTGSLGAEQNLPPPGSTEQPLSPADFQAEKIIRTGNHGPGMQRHPHPQFPDRAPILIGQELLDLQATAQWVTGFKYGKKAVPGMLDHLSAMTFNRSSDNLVMPAEGGVSLRRILLPDLSRVLDISKQDNRQFKGHMVIIRDRIKSV